MKDYRKLAEEALKKSKESKKRLDESVVYPEGLTERMHPQLENELLNRKTSLGDHPIFPDGDESTFEQKIMGERFNEVAKRYKRIIDDLIPDEWWFEPKDVIYLEGCGQPMEITKLNIRDIINKKGINSLKLSQKSELEMAFIKFASLNEN